MTASMTLAEIQAKYNGTHTPEEIAQYQQNIARAPHPWRDQPGRPVHQDFEQAAI